MFNLLEGWVFLVSFVCCLVLIIVVIQEAEALRALRLTQDDSRQMTSVQSHTDKCSNKLFNGTPGPFTPLVSDKFRSAA